MLKKWKNLLIIFLLLITVGLSIFIYMDFKGDPKNTYDSSVIFERILTIREVSLVQYHYTGVAGFEEARSVGDIDIPFTKKHFLVKYDGYMKAGIDFDDVKIEVQDGSVRIDLPKARIMENVIDEKSIVVYDESMNILNPIRIEDYNSIIIGEKDRMEQEALDRGILEQAGEQAELLIRSMVNDMGFEEIDIAKAGT